MALAEENDAISKEDAKNSKWVKISMRKDTPTDESSVCSTPLPPMKKLDGVEPISGPKTIKSILRSKFTFKAETLKGVTINEPSSAPTKGNKSSSALRVNSAHRHLKSLGRSSSRPKNPRPSKHFFPLCIHCGFSDHISDVCVKYPVCDICRSYDHDTHGHNRIISLRRGINPRNPQHVMNSCETCGSTIHTTTDHINIEWFRRGEELQEKKAKALKSCKAESSNANRSKTPTRSGCSRHMTGVKSYLHEYVEKSRPKVVFGDDSTCTTEASVNSVMLSILFSMMRKEEQSSTLITDIIKRDKIQAKPDKTEHKTESVEKSKVNPDKVKATKSKGIKL
nr:retrovirus-related Pol polyprotein from transposon TNT 1-94 [Tanacetum cinerariifolium]